MPRLVPVRGPHGHHHHEKRGHAASAMPRVARQVDQGGRRRLHESAGVAMAVRDRLEAESLNADHEAVLLRQPLPPLRGNAIHVAYRRRMATICLAYLNHPGK
eukprot:333527-Pyramimonas_sp.AAC.1